MADWEVEVTDQLLEWWTTLTRSSKKRSRTAWICSKNVGPIWVARWWTVSTSPRIRT